MKQKYIRTFAEIELNILNTIEKDKERYSSMSIFSYFLKLFREAGTEDLEIGYRTFLKKYCRYHEKISKDTLAARIALLVNKGLLELVKKGQKHIYRLGNLKKNSEILNSSVQKSDTFSDTFSDTSNKPKSIDMTAIEEDSQNCKDKSLNKNIYNKYISASEIDAVVSEVIKNLDIRRKIVKNAIRSKIKRVAHKLNPAGAYSYVEKVAIDTYNFFRISSERANKIATILMNKKKAKEKKSLKFQNYPQREYDHAALDEELIGWDIEENVVADADVIVNTVLIANKTNCFEDDEDLLGWDD